MVYILWHRRNWYESVLHLQGTDTWADLQSLFPELAEGEVVRGVYEDAVCSTTDSVSCWYNDGGGFSQMRSRNPIARIIHRLRPQVIPDKRGEKHPSNIQIEKQINEAWEKAAADVFNEGIE